MIIDEKAEPAGWRPQDWLRQAGYPFTLPVLMREIYRGNIDSRKAGRNRVILTSPRAYLESLPRR
jgi:hypothetical protein